jgi:hypothetical protein
MRHITREDTARIRAACSALVNPDKPIETEVHRLLRRDPYASIIALATSMQVLPRRVSAVIRQSGTRRDAAESDHPDYGRTWYGRHIKDVLSKDRMKAAVEQIRNLFGGTADDEILAFIIGAPSARAVRELLAEPQSPPAPTETAGISESRPASLLKHVLNEILIDAAGYDPQLVGLEIGQGVGDGSLRYRRHGLLIALERDARYRRVAAGRVPHLEIPFHQAGTDGDPLAYPPEVLREVFANDGIFPVLMFDQPITATLALDRLRGTPWRLNWLDIDPLGFAETSEIDVKAFYEITTDEAIVCITNGGGHAERYGIRTMSDILTEGCTAGTALQKQIQHAALLNRLVEVEAAYRVKQAMDHGFALHPLLLFDGRSGSAGVVRSYYLLNKQDDPKRCSRYMAIDREHRLRLIAPDLISIIQMAATSPSSGDHVLLLKISDVDTYSGELSTSHVQWLRTSLNNRISRLRKDRRGTSK